MAFRTVIVDSHSKLEYSLNYLVYRTPDQTKRILLDEIHTLIIQSTAVSITTSLLEELIAKKIKVIFCDEKRNPCSELIPYYGSHNCSKRVLEQINWSIDSRNNIWKSIVKRKILNQSKSLEKAGLLEKAIQLEEYSKEVVTGDTTNREGHAAKVYFNNMFYHGFTRDDDSKINAYLNYGYTIILSQFNRAIVSAGYLTQLGIHHRSEFNEFNFSCDLMEPFREIVDEKAKMIKVEENFKDEMINLLSLDVIIDGKTQNLANAISIYCESVFNALDNNQPEKILFIESYEL